MDEEKNEGKLIEEYTIKTGTLETVVNIVEKENLPRYHLILPHVDIATAALLDDIKDRMISSIEMNVSEILDSHMIGKLQVEFEEKADIILAQELPNIDETVKKQFILDLIHELMGLDDIEYFLNDSELEEIVINSATEPVRVYHKKYGWLETNITPDTEDRIKNYANSIARRIGREVTTLNPLLDAHLLSKDRANAILSPIATKGHTITIRKFARDPWTCTDFIKNGTVSDEVLSLIWLMIQYEMNIMITGGTGSGKTSFLNICMPFMPPNQRIISIEDTRELQLPEFLYWCPLTTREPNPEGKGEITMLNLLVNALRMRPDRIIMGEVRKKREAEVMFEAMHTGHSVYATLHADTCDQTITRLTNPPIDIPHSMLEAVHLNVVLFRDRRKGQRRVSEVGEFVMDEEKRNQGIIRYKPNIIYRWDARDDLIKSSDQPIRLFTELYRHTGLSKNEVIADIEEKKRILNYLIDKGIRQVDEVGYVMKLYYTAKDTLMKFVEKNAPASEILKKLRKKKADEARQAQEEIDAAHKTEEEEE